MSNLLSFIKTKQFFVHLGLAALSMLLMVFIMVKYLSSYTDHGEFVEVPDFSEKRISELQGFIQDKGVNFLIIDSLYDPNRTAGIVIKQEPTPNSKVKHNRIIYLYVTSMVPPQVIMPKLKDRSERQAKLIILSYGLKIGRVTTKNADCNGCVLEQLNKGQVIEPGQNIKKGSVIDLIVGAKNNFSGAGNDSLVQDAGKETFDNE